MVEKTFSIVYKNPPKDERVLDKIYQAFLENGLVLDEDNPELTVVLGGDGTFMETIHDQEMEGHFLLINNGHIGFFSDYDITEIDSLLQDIEEKKENLETLPLLILEGENINEKSVSDIAIQSDKTAEFIIRIDGREFTKARATGIVIGTPVSSTAFLGSLSSPAVISSDNIYQYSFIADVRNRLYKDTIEKAILSKDNILELSIPYGDCALFIDGIKKMTRIEGDLQIRMERETDINLVHFGNKDNLRRIIRQYRGLKED